MATHEDEARLLSQLGAQEALDRLLELRKETADRGDHNLVAEIDVYLARKGVVVEEPKADEPEDKKAAPKKDGKPEAAVPAKGEKAVPAKPAK